MAGAMKVHLKRVHFGIEAPKSTLDFSIAAASGFTVTAVLDCNSKVVASWEWVELKNGQQISEQLTPKGTYTLTLSAVFTGNAPATAEIAVSVNAIRKSMKLTGRQPDIGKGLAVVFIQ